MQGRSGGLGLSGGYSNERGKNDYPFLFQRAGAPDTSLSRKHADYRKEEVYFNGNVKADEYSTVEFSVQNVKADRGAPGPIFGAGDFSLARETDKDVNVHLGYHDERVSGTLLSLNTGFQYGYETYVDPNPVFPLNSFYKNILVNVNPQVQSVLTDEDRIIVGGEFVQGILQGNDFGVTIQRTQSSVYVSNEYTLQFNRLTFDRLVFYETLRYDHFSDVGHAVTPKVGMNLRVLQEGDLRIRASYGQSFRAPSFNDLYYVPFNNPALHPEHSKSLDAGILGGGSFWGTHSVEATYFYADTRDRIIFDPLSIIPVNIGRTLSQGVESAYRGRLFDGFVDLSLSYTYTDARKRNSASATDSTFDKQLTFIPQNLFKGAVAIHIQPFTISIFRLFTGVRPVNEDNSQTLPANSLTNASLSVNTPFKSIKVSAKFEVDNLSDVRYQVYPNYPMPGRTYKVDFGVTY